MKTSTDHWPNTYLFILGNYWCQLTCMLKISQYQSVLLWISATSLTHAGMCKRNLPLVCSWLRWSIWWWGESYCDTLECCWCWSTSCFNWFISFWKYSTTIIYSFIPVTFIINTICVLKQLPTSYSVNKIHN